MNEINERLCKRMVKYAKFFQMVPFMRTMILNGSLAIGCTHEESDIDVLTVTKPNRLYTCRFLMKRLAKHLGLRAHEADPSSHTGAFCFNYFTTADNLDLPAYKCEITGSNATINFSHGMFILGDKNVYEKYRSYLEKYAIKKSDQREIEKYLPVKNYLFFSLIRLLLEFFLSGKYGDRFEERAKQKQLKKALENDNKKIASEKIDFYSRNDREFFGMSTAKILNKKYAEKINTQYSD